MFVLKVEVVECNVKVYIVLLKLVVSVRYKVQNIKKEII